MTEDSKRKDLATISISSEVAAMAEDLGAVLHLSDVQNVARLAALHALLTGADTSPVTLPDRGPTWGSAAFTQEGALVAAARTLRPNDQNLIQAPHRTIEALMNRGIQLLHEKVKDGTIGSLADLIDAGSAEGASEAK